VGFLQHRFATLMVQYCSRVLTGWLFTRVPAGFIPMKTPVRFCGHRNAQARRSTNASDSKPKPSSCSGKRETFEGFFFRRRRPRSASQGGQNFGRMFFHLQIARRTQTRRQGVIKQIRVKLAEHSGFKVYPQNPPTIRLGAT